MDVQINIEEDLNGSKDKSLSYGKNTNRPSKIVRPSTRWRWASMRWTKSSWHVYNFFVLSSVSYLAAHPDAHERPLNAWYRATKHTIQCMYIIHAVLHNCYWYTQLQNWSVDVAIIILPTYILYYYTNFYKNNNNIIINITVIWNICIGKQIDAAPSPKYSRNLGDCLLYPTGSVILINFLFWTTRYKHLVYWWEVSVEWT